MDNKNEFFKNRAIIILTSITLIVLAIFIVVQTIGTLQGMFMPTNAPANTITVSGKGTATSTPNTVTLSYGVSATAPTVAIAQTKTTKNGNVALAFLKKENITGTDIKTTSYTILPNYENIICAKGIACNSRKQNGYKVSQRVSVKVTDIKKIGVLLQGLGQTGVTNLYAGSAYVANPTIYKNLARTRAIAQAKKDAVKLSQELGVHLGRLVRFSQFSNQPRPIYARAESVSISSASKIPSYPTGNSTYTSNVTLIYAIY
ncbi:MAG TPA: DUF541 domain-containing protein [Candidatus Kaiserbacteria bacterium]|nr:DUF541 domain-containing protein [Candidatus Kaiserbacteria bacterium]